MSWAREQMARACTQYLLTGSVPLLPRLLSGESGAIGILATSGILHHPQVVHRSPPKGEAKGKARSHSVLLSRCLFQKTSTVLPMKVALFLTQLEPALGHVAGFGAFCSDRPLPGQQDLTPKGVAQHLRVKSRLPGPSACSEMQRVLRVGPRGSGDTLHSPSSGALPPSPTGNLET